MLAIQAQQLQEFTSVPNRPGRLSSVYDCQKAVGKGGYAIVYRGVRREDGRIIAVKKVEVGWFAGAEAMQGREGVYGGSNCACRIAAGWL